MTAAGASRHLRAARSDKDDATRRDWAARHISRPVPAAPGGWRPRKTAGRGGGESGHAPMWTRLRTRGGRLPPRSGRRRPHDLFPPCARGWEDRRGLTERRAARDASMFRRACPLLWTALPDGIAVGDDRLAVLIQPLIVSLRARRGSRPEPALLVSVETAGHRRGLRPDESVAVAHGLAQRRAKIGVIAPADDAENALLLLDRGILQDGTEARDLRRGVARQAARHQFVMDACRAGASDDAGDVIVPIPEPIR